MSNQREIEYWNTGPGARWVKYQTRIDSCFENVNRRLLELCRVTSGDSVLDMGCGTGSTSIALAERFGDSVSITGIDVSRPLLAHARDRFKQKGLSHIRLLEADIQERPLESRYQRVVSRFGVMFFSDPYQAFTNIAASMAPGASMVFIAWAPVEDNPWFNVPRDIAVARLGPPSEADPRAPGPFAFSDLDYLADILDRSGFQDIALGYEDNEIDTDLELDELADLATNLGPATRLINEYQASAEDQAAIREEITRALSNYGTDAGFAIPIKLVVCEVGSAA